jgi:electron transfer flavoprotein beta subunit
VDPVNRNAIVERKVGKGDREIIECELPALFTTNIGLNDPRYPTLPGRLRSKQTEIIRLSVQNEGWENSDQAYGPKEVCLLPLNPKPKPIFTPAPSLSAYERMQQVIKGDPTEKKGIVIDGDPQNIARNIIEILRQNGYVMSDKLISSENEHSSKVL